MTNFSDKGAWQRQLRFDFPSVRFESTDNPRGTNAVCEGILVGRFFEDHAPPYGVLYGQPRSCGGKPFEQQ